VAPRSGVRRIGGAGSGPRQSRNSAFSRLFFFPVLRSAPIAVCLAACAAPLALGAPARVAAPPAFVGVAECSTGASAEDRFAEFRGGMRQVAGGETMGMRFALQEKMGDREFEPVRAPGLRVWHRSRPGVKRFVYRQQVLELAEGSDYRVRVRFRWYDAEGEVVREVSRRSAACRQKGDLPNLRVIRVDGRPAGARGLVRYSLTVANSGRAESAATGVGLSVDGAAVDTAQVQALAPGESRRLLVNGPECAASVRAAADPSDTVVESAEDDNTLLSSCPLRR